MTAKQFCIERMGFRDPALIEMLSAVLRREERRKGQHVIETGMAVTELYLLESGLMRGFYTLENGKEITDCLAFESGSAVAPSADLDAGTKADMSIEALEDCVLWAVPVAEVLRLGARFPEIVAYYAKQLRYWGRQHMALKRALVACDARQRYRWFLETYPGLIDRMEQKDVASYLKMTTQYLSRIRHDRTQPQ